MKIYSDGFCMGSNPSKIGGGYTIIDENNQLLCCKQILKEGMTNNEAELIGCVEAMELANQGDTISTDSQNTILWITHAHKIPRKDPQKEEERARKDLDPIKKRGLELIRVKQLSLIFEPREFNLAGLYNEEFEMDDWINKFK